MKNGKNSKICHFGPIFHTKKNGKCNFLGSEPPPRAYPPIGFSVLGCFMGFLAEFLVKKWKFFKICHF